MKYLPTTFPIRYVITVTDHTENKKNSGYFNDMRKKVLWDQLITFLQKTPLEPEDLSLGFTSINYSYKDAQLCHIPMLGRDRDWAKKASAKLMEEMPEGTFSDGWGSAFNLGLIAYKGMMELPLFWKTYTSASDPISKRSEIDLRPWGHYNLNKEQAENVYKFYKGFSQIDYWDYEKKRSTDKIKVYNLLIPYSKLWAMLDGDRSKFKGCIPPMTEFDVAGIEKIDLQDKPEYIQVTVVKNLPDLFWEEVSALYKIASFCNNCGRILPFTGKNQYCSKEDNEECHKDRARKRARKRRK